MRTIHIEESRLSKWLVPQGRDSPDTPSFLPLAFLFIAMIISVMTKPKVKTELSRPNSGPAITRRELEMVATLWRRPGLCRWELSEQLQWRPNTIGDVVRSLLEQRVLREGSPALTRGRPKTPLYLDPDSRHVLGLVITPDKVECARINVLGDIVGEKFYKSVPRRNRIDIAARTLFEKTLTPDCLSAGVVVSQEIFAAKKDKRTQFLTKLRQSLTEASPHCTVTLSYPWRARAARILLTHSLHARMLFLGLETTGLHSLISTESGILETRALGELSVSNRKTGTSATLNAAWSELQDSVNKDTLNDFSLSISNVLKLLDLQLLVINTAKDISPKFLNDFVESLRRHSSPRIELAKFNEFFPDPGDPLEEAGSLAIEGLLFNPPQSSYHFPGDSSV